MKFASIITLLFLILSCTNSANQNYEIEQEQGKDATLVEFNQEFKSQEALELNSSAFEQVRNGNFREARGLFSEALKIEPENPVIINNLGLVERELGNFDKAVELFKKSFDTSQHKYLQSASNLALTYYKLGEYQKAIETSKFVLDRNPNRVTSISSRLTLSLSYADMGECSKAEQELMFLKQEIENNEFSQQLESLEKRIKNCVQQNM